jgi:hypothetical protein
MDLLLQRLKVHATLHTEPVAIWQFDVCVFPRTAAFPTSGVDGYFIEAVGPERANQAIAWCRERWPAQSWMDDFLVFGDENGCRIDVLLDLDGSAELKARIDVRAEHSEFCRSICDLAVQLDCMLFSPELWRLIQPDANDLQIAIQGSRASRFTSDPHAVLRGDD